MDGIVWDTRGYRDRRKRRGGGERGVQHEEVRKSATREIPRASEAAHAPACRRIPTRTGWGTPSARTWPAAPWRPKRLRTPAPAPDSMPPARLKGDLFPQSASAEKRTSAALTEMPIGLDSRTGMWAIRRGIARSAPPKARLRSAGTSHHHSPRHRPRSIGPHDRPEAFGHESSTSPPRARIETREGSQARGSG